VRRLEVTRCRRLDDSDPPLFKRPGTQGRWSGLRPGGYRTDGNGLAKWGNPWTTPGKTHFGWAVQAQHISAASKDGFKRVERCVPHLFCRVRGAVGKEKGV